MNRGSIVSQVLMRMDEISPFANVQAMQNVPVEKFLNQSAEELLYMLPSFIIGKSLPIPTEETVKETVEGKVVDVVKRLGVVDVIAGIGSLPIPTDFIKINRFKMAAWQRPVTEAISEQSPEYAQQFNKYQRGGVAKPVVAIVSNGDKKTLEYYSVPASDTTHKVKEASYIPHMLPENLPEHLIEPLAWLTAYTVFLVMGQEQSSSAALLKVTQYIQNRTGNVSNRVQQG